jgi:hypothetical protein
MGVPVGRDETVAADFDVVAMPAAMRSDAHA